MLVWVLALFLSVLLLVMVLVLAVLVWVWALFLSVLLLVMVLVYRRYRCGFRVTDAVLPHHHLPFGRGRHGQHRTIRPLRTIPCRRHRRVRRAPFGGNPCRVWARGRGRGGGDWSPRGGLVRTHAPFRGAKRRSFEQRGYSFFFSPYSLTIFAHRFRSPFSLTVFAFFAQHFRSPFLLTIFAQHFARHFSVTVFANLFFTRHFRSSFSHHFRSSFSLNISLTLFARLVYLLIN